MSEQKQIGNKFERLVMVDTGGSWRPGSGCLWFAKGDVITDNFLIECKASNTGKLSVPVGWINKIRFHARDEKRQWALAVKPTMKYTDDYWVIVEDDCNVAGIPCEVDTVPHQYKSLLVLPESAPRPYAPVRHVFDGGRFIYLLMHRIDFIELAGGNASGG